MLQRVYPDASIASRNASPRRLTFPDPRRRNGCTVFASGRPARNSLRVRAISDFINSVLNAHRSAVDDVICASSHARRALPMECKMRPFSKSRETICKKFRQLAARCR